VDSPSLHSTEEPVLVISSSGYSTVMWAWRLLPILVGVVVPAHSAYPEMNAATLLDRILAQGMLPERQYDPADRYEAPRMQQQDARMQQQDARIQQQDARMQQQDDYLYPQLSATQRKFAVNPGMAEFYNNNPDFLKFGLEEMEEMRAAPSAKHTQQKDLSDEESVIDPGPPEMNSGVELDKKDVDPEFRGPHAAPRVQYTENQQINDVYFTTIVAVSTALSIFAVVAAGFCYHRISRNHKTSEEVEYPAYGVTGPAKDPSPSGDRKLAQSAQMYHYQHQKNQMIAFGRANGGPGNNSDNESDEGEAEEGDYTVYECPGLASTDEMEVKNPLFNDDPTPNNGNGKPETENSTQNTE